MSLADEKTEEDAEKLSELYFTILLLLRHKTLLALRH